MPLWHVLFVLFLSPERKYCRADFGCNHSVFPQRFGSSSDWFGLIFRFFEAVLIWNTNITVLILRAEQQPEQRENAQADVMESCDHTHPCQVPCHCRGMAESLRLSAPPKAWGLLSWQYGAQGWWCCLSSAFSQQCLLV